MTRSMRRAEASAGAFCANGYVIHARAGAARETSWTRGPADEQDDPVFVGFFVFMLACMIVGLLGFVVESRARDEEEIIELAPIEYAPKRAATPERSIETLAISRAVSNAR